MSAAKGTYWFWDRWAADLGVRKLSPAARGVWIDLLVFAAAGTPTGYVTDRKGRSIPLDEIARFTNCPIQELPKLLDEIAEKGVASRDRTGRLFNRFMVKESALSAKRSKAGKEGYKSLKNKKTPVLPEANSPAKQGEGKGLDPPLVHSEGLEGSGAGTARAGALITEAAFVLADQVCDALGWDRDDIRRVGVPYETQKWVTAGWDAGLCVATVIRVAAGRDVVRVRYFEKPIAAAHAQMATPLPVAVIKPQETVHAAPQSAFAAAKDRGRAAHAKLQAFIAEHDRGEGDGQVIEIMPGARRRGS